jgi:hypothetical protein
MRVRVLNPPLGWQDTVPFMGEPYAFRLGPVTIYAIREADGWALYSREAGESAVRRETLECWALCYWRGIWAADHWPVWLRECMESQNERGQNESNG